MIRGSRFRSSVAVIGGIAVGLLMVVPEAIGDYGYRSLRVSDTSTVEGAAAEFVVTLSKRSRRTVTVTYTTIDESAEAPDDYASREGALIFHPGQTLHTVSVLVEQDRADEPTEAFRLRLLDSENAFISDGDAIATIGDDDPRPTIRISNVRVTEGDSGTVAAQFTVSLSAASGRVIEVDYETEDGSARAPGDFFAKLGTLTFTPGTATKTIAISVRGDLEVELNERFQVILSDAKNGFLIDSRGDCRILDDDP